jgi:DNA polymerase III delta prime subunit
MTKNQDNKQELNANILAKEFIWLYNIMQFRFTSYFGGETKYKKISDIKAPNLTTDKSTYAEIVNELNFNNEERIILLLALAPHLSPQLLDMFFTKNETYGRGFTEFGGVKGNQHSGFIPTGETAAFVIAGTDISKRFNVMSYFDEEHSFRKKSMLTYDRSKSSEPILSSILNITKGYLSYFTTGKEYIPPFNSEFPAQKITTRLDWDDLVVEPYVLDEIEEILKWLEHKNEIMNNWGLEKFIKPGYRSLLYGPPGTGKTLTVSLLGKTSKRDVYRVDLSKIVSKYIGETEKNLANIFDQAENKEWILFFDEADAIFGKRTNTQDAKDRYANQEIAYLLQRMEEFPGLLILATNLKSNMDEAFARRFQSMIYFPLPSHSLRYRLWQNTFSKFDFDDNINLKEIAKNYELTGGTIINILSYVSLQAADRGNKKITKKDIIQGIRKEFRKEGKTI